MTLFLLLLETSMLPATLDECARTRPDLGRPVWVISKQNGTGTPYHYRVCAWREFLDKLIEVEELPKK